MVATEEHCRHYVTNEFWAIFFHDRFFESSLEEVKIEAGDDDDDEVDGISDLFYWTCGPVNRHVPNVACVFLLRSRADTSTRAVFLSSARLFKIVGIWCRFGGCRSCWQTGGLIMWRLSAFSSPNWTWPSRLLPDCAGKYLVELYYVRNIIKCPAAAYWSTAKSADLAESRFFFSFTSMTIHLHPPSRSYVDQS